MADFEVFSCANGWVYLRWEIPAGVSRYRITREDKTDSVNKTLVSSGKAASHRTPWTLVNPGEAGASDKTKFRYARYFPATFDAGGSYSLRLLEKVGDRVLAVPDKEYQAAITVDMKGVLVGWKKRYKSGSGPLWVEMSNEQSKTYSGWERIGAFDENEVTTDNSKTEKNVKFPSKRFGYYVDKISDPNKFFNHNLEYTLRITKKGGPETRKASVTHDWKFGSKLMFFVGSDSHREEFFIVNGGKLEVYCDYYAQAVRRKKKTTMAILGTRFDDGAPTNKYYLANASDKSQAKRFVSAAEGSTGLIQKVVDNFGGHHVTDGFTELTTLITPMIGAVGYAWGAVDSPKNPVISWGPWGNRRAVMYVGAFPGSAGDEAQIAVDVKGTFAHEYQHLNFHKAHLIRRAAGASAEDTAWFRDRTLDEGSGFYAEDVVNSFNQVFWDSAMESQGDWHDYFLYDCWPSKEGSYIIYARGAAWVMYNCNRLRNRAGMSGHTHVNAPRRWKKGYAEFFREFQMVIALNQFMEDDKPLDLHGFTGPSVGAPKDKLDVSFKRKDSGDGKEVVTTKLLRDWNAGREERGRIDGMPPLYTVGKHLRGRGKKHYMGRGTRWNAKKKEYKIGFAVRYASALLLDFAPEPLGAKGALHVELKLAKNSKARIKKAIAAMRRKSDGKWVYQEAKATGHALLHFPEYGDEVDRVVIVVPTEKPVSTSVKKASSAPKQIVKYMYYLTRHPNAALAGWLPDDAWRGGDNIIAVAEGADPVSYIGPGKLQAWVAFNQEMSGGKKFHMLHADDSEVELTRATKLGEYHRHDDMWESKDATLAAAGDKDGEVVTLEIGRVTRNGDKLEGGIKNFAGVLLDTRPTRKPGEDPTSDKRFRAILDTKPPDIKKVSYVNGDGVAGTMADGKQLVGVVELEVEAEDKTSGIAAVEVMGRPTKSREVWSAGRHVAAPDPATGKYPETLTQKFYWNTSSAKNGELEIEVVVWDRVGNAATKTFKGSVIRNPKPGASADSPNLVDEEGDIKPDLKPITAECEFGKGSWKSLAAGKEARGKLRFALKGTFKKNTRLVVKAKAKSTKGDREIWSEWLTPDTLDKKWELNSNALPEGEVTLTFQLIDETKAKSGKVELKFKIANLPPRIVPQQPAITTRGAVDVFLRVDDRCAPAIKVSKAEAEWKPADGKSMDADLKRFPGGSYLLRTGLHPMHAGTKGCGKKDGVFKVSGFQDVALMVPLDSNDYRPLSGRVVRLTMASQSSPTKIYDATFAVDPALLVVGKDASGKDTTFKINVQSSSKVEASDVTFEYVKESGEDVNFQAVTDEKNGDFHAKVTLASGQSRGLVKITAADALGLETKMELPVWFVKDAVASDDDFAMVYRPGFYDDELDWERQYKTRKQSDADKTITNGNTAAIRMGELVHHLPQILLDWEDTGGTVSNVAFPVVSSKLADSVTSKFSMGTIADGEGKFLLKVSDAYSNEAAQEFDGWELKGTAPQANVTTTTTPADNPKIELDAAPAGIAKSRVMLKRSYKRPSKKKKKDETDWNIKVELAGQVTELKKKLTPGKYKLEVGLVDDLGNWNDLKKEIDVTA